MRNRSVVYMGSLAFAGTLLALAGRSAVSAGQGGALVRLQNVSPGVAQVGNANITGRLLSGPATIGDPSALTTALLLTGSGTDAQWLHFRKGTNVLWHINNASNSLNFAESGISDYRFVLQPGGNVGIGTNSADLSLDVRKLSQYGGPSIGGTSGSSWLYMHVAVDPSLIWSSTGSLRFGTEVNKGAGYTERARIATNGNLLVGTTTNNARVTAVSALGSAGFFRSDDPSTGAVDALVGVSKSGNGAGVSGFNTATSGFTQGVYTEVSSPGGAGVNGKNAVANNAGFGVLGENPSATGWGLYALGRSGASGTKAFAIDHPFDPANKTLLHYSSESPEPQNFYNGTVLTDAKGYATVTMPDYYESINRDARYTLTVVDDGETMGFVMAKVVSKMRDGRFVIRTSEPNVEVSWEVKALRNDRWVREYGAPTEEEKTGIQKGRYYSPELYGQPASKGIGYRGEPLKNGNERP